MGKFICGDSTEMQLMFLETWVEYKGLRSEKACLVDVNNSWEASWEPLMRTRKSEENQKNRAALVLLEASPLHVAPRSHEILLLPFNSISFPRIEKYSKLIGCS